MNSTRPIQKHEIETHGLGLIQVETAFEIIKQTEKVHFRSVFESFLKFFESNEIGFFRNRLKVSMSMKK